MQASDLPAGLPVPDAASARHSELVRAFIRERIAAEGGAIPFGEYMHLALYAPGLGYYVGGTTKFAAAGDFVTAPEISPLFGRVIARQCAPVLDGLNNASILELGAGSGVLAVDLLGRLAELGTLPDEYLVLEVSAELAARQRARIEAEQPALADRVRWISGLPSGFSGIVVANEVADALPVERFCLRRGEVLQAFVVSVPDGFSIEWREAAPALSEAVNKLGVEFPDGYVSEISLGLGAWTAELARSLDHGLALLFDYGLSRREYYAPDRSGGWLRCHFRHHAHDDPLILPGIQDITAWVDFTAVAEAASAQGAAVAGYTSQALFLLHGGLDEEFQALSPGGLEAQLALSGQLKQLMLPGEMGENFKCIGLTRGEVRVPCALAAADRSATL